MSEPTSKFSSFASLLLGLAFMCSAAIMIKAARAPGIVTAFYRMTVASSVLLIPFIIHVIRNKPFLSKKGIILAMAAGCCFGCDMAFWSSGGVISNATIPTLFANMAPIWVGIGSVFIFKEKHTSGFWLGLFLSIIGTILLVKNDINASNGIIKGASFGTIAGVFYGIFYLLAQSGRKILDTLCFLFISTFSSAIVLTICVIIFDYNITGYDVFTYKIFIAFGLGVQVIGWLFINYSQGYIPASIVAPTLLGQPILTAFLAIILLNEKLSVWHVIGGIIVISGIYIVHFSRNKKSK